MAPGDVCHGPRCSLAGLGPVALEYRSCHWRGGSAGSPQCVRPMGYWFFPVPRPPYVCAVSWAFGLLFTGVPARFAVVRLRCPGPAGSCSPVCSLGVLCCMCGVLGPCAPVHRCACCVRCACAMGGCVPLPPPLIFVFFLFFFTRFLFLFLFLFFFSCFFFFFFSEKRKRVLMAPQPVEEQVNAIGQSGAPPNTNDAQVFEPPDKWHECCVNAIGQPVPKKGRKCPLCRFPGHTEHKCWIKTPTPPKAVDFRTRQAKVRNRTRKSDAEGHRFA